MSSDNNLQKMEEDEITTFTIQDCSKRKCSSWKFFTKRRKQRFWTYQQQNTSFEDLGGPTVDNASPTNDSAKLRIQWEHLSK